MTAPQLWQSIWAGSEQAFVQLMNARAAELGMKDTVYVNCTGLPAAGQQTTARDILRVSCEICRHPAYFNYSSLWLSNPYASLRARNGSDQHQPSGAFLCRL